MLQPSLFLAFSLTRAGANTAAGFRQGLGYAKGIGRETATATLLQMVTISKLMHMCADTRVYATCVYTWTRSQLSEHQLRSIQRLFSCITGLLATTWSSCGETGGYKSEFNAQQPGKRKKTQVVIRRK